MLEYASTISTPGLIYKPGDAIETPRQFHPEGSFFVMVFGPFKGRGNLWGIPTDLLKHLKSEGIDPSDYWTNTAFGNEVSAQNLTAGYYTMSRMLCEFRLSQVEQAYIYWDYSVQSTLHRTKDL